MPVLASSGRSRRKVASLLVILLALLGAGSSTYALYTDNQAVSGNRFLSEVLDLAQGPQSTQMKVQRLSPGDSRVRAITVMNSGTTGLEYSGKVAVSGGNQLAQYLEVSVVGDLISAPSPGGAWAGPSFISQLGFPTTGTEGVSSTRRPLTAGQRETLYVYVHLKETAPAGYSDLLSELTFTFDPRQIVIEEPAPEPVEADLHITVDQDGGPSFVDATIPPLEPGQSHVTAVAVTNIGGDPVDLRPSLASESGRSISFMHHWLLSGLAAEPTAEGPWTGSYWLKVTRPPTNAPIDTQETQRVNPGQTRVFYLYSQLDPATPTSNATAEMVVRLTFNPWSPSPSTGKIVFTYDFRSTNSRCTSYRVVLPLLGNQGNVGSVNWGDGASNLIENGGGWIHTFPTGKVLRTVTFTGKAHRISTATVGGAGSSYCLTGITRWDAETDTQRVNLDSQYNLVQVVQPPPTVVDMKNMFSGNSSFNQNISGWDVSRVKDMTEMFRGSSKFNQNLSGWDVSRVNSRTDFDKGAAAWTLPKPNWPTE